MSGFIEKVRHLLKNSPESTKDANKFIYEDNILNPVVGDDKITSLIDVNQEEKLHASSSKYIIGMIYTFVYRKSVISPAEDHDNTPLVLCIRSFDTRMMGINMNLLPRNVRLDVLQFMYNTNPEFYDKYDTGDSTDLMVNEKFIAAMMGVKNSEFIQLIKSHLNVDISYAFRIYELKDIINPRMIEIPKWEYIPLYNYSKNSERMNLSKIYKMY